MKIDLVAEQKDDPSIIKDMGKSNGLIVRSGNTDALAGFEEV
jgi:hypothetical protein